MGNYEIQFCNKDFKKMKECAWSIKMDPMFSIIANT